MMNIFKTKLNMRLAKQYEIAMTAFNDQMMIERSSGGTIGKPVWATGYQSEVENLNQEILDETDLYHAGASAKRLNSLLKKVPSTVKKYLDSTDNFMYNF